MSNISNTTYGLVKGAAVGVALAVLIPGAGIGLHSILLRTAKDGLEGFNKGNNTARNTSNSKDQFVSAQT